LALATACDLSTAAFSHGQPWPCALRQCKSAD